MGCLRKLSEPMFFMGEFFRSMCPARLNGDPCVSDRGEVVGGFFLVTLLQLQAKESLAAMAKQRMIPQTTRVAL